MNRIQELGEKIDIGCGIYKKEGYIGLDIKDFGQEIVWDIRNGLPFKDKSIEKINCSHTIEHLTRAELEPLMEEIKRVLKGEIEISVPHLDTDGAYDYAHRTFWDERSIESFMNSAGLQKIFISCEGGNLVARYKV